MAWESHCADTNTYFVPARDRRLRSALSETPGLSPAEVEEYLGNDLQLSTLFRDCKFCQLEWLDPAKPTVQSPSQDPNLHRHHHHHHQLGRTVEYRSFLVKIHTTPSAKGRCPRYIPGVIGVSFATDSQYNVIKSYDTGFGVTALRGHLEAARIALETILSRIIPDRRVELMRQDNFLKNHPGMNDWHPDFRVIIATESSALINLITYNQKLTWLSFGTNPGNESQYTFVRGTAVMHTCNYPQVINLLFDLGQLGVGVKWWLWTVRDNAARDMCDQQLAGAGLAN
ncbi:hypothetical protein F5B22DRAFT_27220 [Xylaria bambusicola]|uniref:uncharacterized protein n=1 Tax=Xylaria bambusicola TaxID=326684 RepID=UPI0020076746|nr:uncharacterized protein F5B22DRAFT_27220 [Xylaria bambusicola]KAI0528225.1 hypothetical protein F5B22DRAFT_27220 [Xylaria bambusicola]